MTSNLQNIDALPEYIGIFDNTCFFLSVYVVA